ncbi:hypothetical protein BMS3Bbin01_02939 [bacterium BMS3Bbin01]|nr:hypothetical protein BMS3Bbin01_02939 [bacterium BMS3Bbin01]
MPAVSPTLSPTLSAITAGLRASSSGIPASSFPTRSAAISAAFVKMPPPTLANRAIEDAPRPMAVTMSAHPSTLSHTLKTRYPSPTPVRPRPATVKPITAPPRNARGSAAVMPPVRAASVVRLFAAVATRIPTNPANADRKAPKMYATAPHGRPHGRSVAIRPAISTTNTATHVYSRRKNAIAPSRIASEISTIRALPRGAARTCFE